MQKKAILGMLKETAREWSADKSPRLAAALAYYTLFSIAPLLLIAISIAGLVYGEEAARGEIVATFQSVIGENAAKGVEEMIENARREKSGIIATVVGIVTLLFGASGVFTQLQDAMNTVWGIEPKKEGFAATIRKKVLSFAMVMVIGFLLLVSLVLSAALAAIGKYLEGRIPGNAGVWHAIHFVVALGVFSLLFAMIFRYLPARRVPWGDVWAGAIFTSVLFGIGKFALGLYLGKSSVASTFGAAGSLVILLLWVYYSGLILLFGAEFTEVYARRHDVASARARGGPIVAGVGAQPVALREPVASKTRGGKGKLVAAGVGGAAVGTVAGGIGTLVVLTKIVKRLFRW
jgi:membrane protein